MNVLKFCLSAALLLPAVLLPATPGAFAGANVNVYDDAVYLYLDKLRAAGLIRTYMPNQRPLSRETVTRLIAEARRNAAGNIAGDSELNGIILELEREFPRNTGGNTFSFTPLDSFSFLFTATNQEASATPNNRLGRTSGLVQPLLSYTGGDHFDKYANAYFSTAHKIQASPFFSAYLQPKFYAKQGSDNGGVGLYRGYAKARFGNTEILAGRDDLRWGPGENALMFSGNARALDMIKFSSPEPFRFPGVFRHLGYFRGTAFFSWLRNDFNPAGTQLTGYRLDYSPFSWVDIGFDHVVFFGGEGLESPGFRQGLAYFVGFLVSSGLDDKPTNHLIGPDMTLRIPKAMGMELYGKITFEDTQAQRRYMLESCVAYLAGIYLPKVRGLERLSLRTEFNYTGQYLYRHGQYIDGFTLNNKFMGYDAGSDTYSGTFTARHQFNLNEFVKLDLRYLRRSADQYRWVVDPNRPPRGNDSYYNIGIERTLSLPKETHFIIRVGGRKKLSENVNLFTEAGYDRRRNVEFTNGKSAHEFSLRVGLAFRNLIPALP
jgi:hypothetical protein